MIRVTQNVPQCTAALRQRANTLSERLAARVNELSIRLQRLILSRPGTPASADHRRKGWLANSVGPVPAVVEGNTVVGGVEGAGGAAWYGRMFEDGTSRSFEIRPSSKKALMFELGGQTVFVRRAIHPPFDASRLAFMRPALLEFESTIGPELRMAVVEGLQ